MLKSSKALVTKHLQLKKIYINKLEKNKKKKKTNKILREAFQFWTETGARCRAARRPPLFRTNPLLAYLEIAVGVFCLRRLRMLPGAVSPMTKNGPGFRLATRRLLISGRRDFPRSCFFFTISSSGMMEINLLTAG